MPSQHYTQRLRQLNALLEAALGMSQEQRTDWLDQLPPQHRALLPELRSLLARSNVETDDFMRRGAHTLLDVQSLGGDRAGDVIGPYRLLSELGHGGMSTVWRAARCDGSLQREVALKLPHAGWAHGIAQRMARERDILASLEHPRIARLYDAGLTREGRPWLAMECVDGVPIDRHCREQHLTVAARLALFLQVTDAVSHAHARLVVHRDLKPSNIMVTPAGEVCLLDFGVAKLMEDDGGPEAQHLTRQLGRPVTPDYAAPEQLGTSAVGTAADVYSLGIVLFELLTGQRPYALEHGQAGGLEQAALHAHVPSVSSRAPDPATRKYLLGDLDTIVAKALRKQPVDRYISVEAFGADIRRHLTGEPVLARAPSWRYRSGKFVRRHRAPIAAAATIGVTLIAGMGVSLWQADLARQESVRAERAKAFVTSILRQAQPREAAGGAVLASDLLSVAGERIETELADDPKAAIELGVVVGERLSSLGDPQRGEAPLRKAAARAEQVYGARHPLTIHARALLAESLSVMKPDEAARIADALVPDALAGLPQTAADAAFALRSQSFQRAKREDEQGAYESLKQAVDVAERHLGKGHEETVLTLGLLANTYGRFFRHDLQLAAAEEARARAALGLEAQRPNVTLTAVERWYAEALRSSNRPAEAVPILRRVLRDQRALDGADTERVRNAVFQLGLALAETGELAESLPLMRDTVALEASQNVDDNEDRRNYRAALARVLAYARFARDARSIADDLQLIVRPLPANPSTIQLVRHVQYAQMLAFLGDAASVTEMVDQVLRIEGQDDAYRFLRAEALSVAALNARLQRQPARALAFARKAWDDPGREHTRTSGQAVIAAELGVALLDQGDIVQAEEFVRRALSMFEQSQVLPSPRSAPAWIALARLLIHGKHPEEAQRVLEPLIAAWEGINPDSAWHGEALYWSSQALAGMGRQIESTRQLTASRKLLLASPLPMLRALAVSGAAGR